MQEVEIVDEPQSQESFIEKIYDELNGKDRRSLQKIKYVRLGHPL
jgi:hypothetical protein